MNSRQLTTRECPVCGGIQHLRLARQEFSALSAGSLMTGYDVVVCQHCGTGFADGLPSQEAFNKYYAQMSKYEHQDTDGQEAPVDLERFGAVVEMVERYLPDRAAAIADVGCATGGLLAAFRAEGYANLLGIDPSAVCVRYVRDRGLKALLGTVLALTASSDRFDLIMFSMVLEHLVDPGGVLSSVWARLNEGALVYVQVPDVTGFARFLDAPFQQFSTEHINFFSPQSLTNLMAKHGFEEVAIQQQVFAQSTLTFMPAVSALYRRSSAPPPIAHDQDTQTALAHYLDASQRLQRRIAETIAQFVAEQTPLLIWGVGTHTLRLLATTSLGEANIVAFVDSNPHYQGKELADRPILAPESIQGLMDPILISSCVLQEEIARQISTQLYYDNKLIRLYGREGVDSL